MSSQSNSVGQLFKGALSLNAINSYHAIGVFFVNSDGSVPDTTMVVREAWSMLIRIHRSCLGQCAGKVGSRC
jgi:hypothetical protein